MVANMEIAVVDRMAALLKTRGINPGDTVGVFTTNSPEMVITLYALSKLGAVSAMINTNLRGNMHLSTSTSKNKKNHHTNPPTSIQTTHSPTASMSQAPNQSFQPPIYRNTSSSTSLT
jgi:acyl-CoA synthetase (AMP-forming)/AMP-acid ligase II